MTKTKSKNGLPVISATFSGPPRRSMSISNGLCGSSKLAMHAFTCKGNKYLLKLREIQPYVHVKPGCRRCSNHDSRSNMRVALEILKPNLIVINN